MNANKEIKMSGVANGHQWSARQARLKVVNGVMSARVNTKLIIGEMQKIAEKHGGKCLSDSYINSKTKLLWQCTRGHQWEAISSNIKRGQWCRICGIKKNADALRLDITEMRQVAEKRGGKCLSDTYVNAQTKLMWQCADGHRWEAIPNNIKRGQWCRKCGISKRADARRLDIAEIHQIAEKRGGKCLSDTYVNAHTKLLWECEKGHQWPATPNSIKSGNWCPICGIKNRADALRLDIAEMCQIAERRGGKCLSDTYVNAHTKLLWECAEGHQWEAPPGMIKSGTWCRICDIKKRADAQKLDIKVMYKMAEERGGKCLSDTYVDVHTKLMFQCAQGHQWEVTPNSIQQGRWCPECSSGLGERICREFFEQIFGEKFHKSYPKWLVNTNGNQMELDGYCESLKLAFEHHGEQHYKAISFFTKREEEFKKRRSHDEVKKRLCALHGIVLIEVPEIPRLLPLEHVIDYIKKECERAGVPIPIDFDIKKINWKKAYATDGLKATLAELRAIAEAHGGRCLSDIYVNSTTKLLWECKVKHQWEAPPSMIKSGNWCPGCAGTIKLSIAEMHQLAEKRSGKCLSETYVNNRTKLLWRCAKGHQWRATPSHIKSGQWCRVCTGYAKLTIDKMREILP